MSPPYPYTIEFYEDEDGSSPVAMWIAKRLSPAERRTMAAALREVLAVKGQDVVKTEFGKNIGGGIIELRLRQDADQLLRRLGGRNQPPTPEMPQRKSSFESSSTLMGRSESSFCTATARRRTIPEPINRSRSRSQKGD